MQATAAISISRPTLFIIASVRNVTLSDRFYSPIPSPVHVNVSALARPPDRPLAANITRVFLAIRLSEHLTRINHALSVTTPSLRYTECAVRQSNLPCSKNLSFFKFEIVRVAPSLRIPSEYHSITERQ